MRVLLSLFFLSLSLLSFPEQGRAEEAPITVAAEVDQAFITIGDPVEFTITARHDPDVEILSRIPPPDGQILKIKKVRDINEKDGDKIITGRGFTLTTFRLGQFILDPIEIQYRIGDGPVQTASTEQIFLTVKSVAEGEEKTDIRGTKSVIGLPRKITPLVLGILVGLLAIFAFIFYKKMQRPKEAPKPAEPPMSPEDEAFHRLNALFDSDLLRRNKVKEYYLNLSEILRSYLERRFAVLAVESTTFEINRSLKNIEVTADLRNLINEVLEASDLAKFAKWKPEPTQIIQLNQKSKQIVEMAKPREVKSGV